METQTHAYFSSPKGLMMATLFGYSTKSLPGLEIHGLGKFSKIIKEKIIFICRQRKIQIPNRRFVICVEGESIEELKPSDLKFLELPLLIMYLSLAEILPVKKLDDCLSSGSISAFGEVHQPHFESSLIDLISKKKICQQLKIILSEEKFPPQLEDIPFWSIDTKLLLQDIPELTFR